MPDTVTVRIPGAVYDECFDPYATEFPRENPEIGKPTVVKIGRGHQYRYTVTRATAALMLEHAADFGAALSYGVDDPSAGRMVARWAERERERLGL